MNKLIDDAIYTVSPEIVRHRYNPLIGIVLTVASIFLLWANSHSAIFEQHEMLSQWNLLLSSCMLCTGAVMICYWLFGDSSAPIEKQSHQRLYRSEFSFDMHELPKIATAVSNGDFTQLQKLPRCFQPTVQVVCYRTDSGSVLASQIVVNRAPSDDIKIFHAGEYKFE
ncbi:MAG: hypothetical protein RR270_02140 [Alistipes sp.]